MWAECSPGITSTFASAVSRQNGYSARIDGSSALVSGGEIGDPGYKTTLWVSNNAGIIAAKGAIAFASNHTNPGGSVFNNVGTAGPNAAAIDALFTDASNAPLDITRIDKIVANLAALKVDATGHLTVPKKA